MDLALLRKYGVTGYFYQFILESTKFFILEDQDAYNLYFKDAVQYLPIENNYVTQLLESRDPAEHRELAKVTILHFLSEKSPGRKRQATQRRYYQRCDYIGSIAKRCELNTNWQSKYRN